MFLSRFGVRMTAMVGALEIILGLGTSVVAPNLLFLMFSLGIISGKGCSFVYMSLNVALFTHFPNAGRQLVSLVSIGEGVSFILALPFVSYFIETYGWRSSLLLLCGMEMHCIPFGLIYSMKADITHGNRVMSNRTRAAKCTTSFSESKKNRFAPNENHVNHPQNNERKKDQCEPYTTATTNKAFEDTECDYANSCNNDSTNDKPKHLDSSPVNDSYITNDDDNQAEEEQPESKKKQGINLKTWKRLATNRMYNLTSISTITFLSTSLVMLTILPDFCMRHGLSLTQGAWNSAISSAGDITARLVGSWLLHSKLLPSIVIFSSAIIMCGITMSVYIAVNTPTYITLTTFFFMLFDGLAYSQYGAIFLDLVDLEDYPLGIGLNESFAGIGLLLCGYLINLYTAYNNNNYDYSILILAVLTTASALPIFIFYICTCRKTKAVILDHHQHTEDASTIKKIAA
ncbi:monocarboxylate transporter 9-like isoform X2 [Octopus sinensis]|nr:monocarboxylate transporter 9-like isoform X2 [Octopus sinensis]